MTELLALCCLIQSYSDRLRPYCWIRLQTFSQSALQLINVNIIAFISKKCLILIQWSGMKIPMFCVMFIYLSHSCMCNYINNYKHMFELCYSWNAVEWNRLKTGKKLFIPMELCHTLAALTIRSMTRAPEKQLVPKDVWNLCKLHWNIIQFWLVHLVSVLLLCRYVRNLEFSLCMVSTMSDLNGINDLASEFLWVGGPLHPIVHKFDESSCGA